MIALRSPGTYVAKVRGAVGSSALDGRLSFTVEDLEKLDAGQVLTAENKKVMDRAEFLKPSQERCKP